MVDFVPGQAVIDVAQRKRDKYMDMCAAIGYGFLPFSFSSLGELKADAVTLLKHIQKFSITQDSRARAAIHIFNKISFAIAKRGGAKQAKHDQLMACLQIININLEQDIWQFEFDNEETFMVRSARIILMSSVFRVLLWQLDGAILFFQSSCRVIKLSASKTVGVEEWVRLLEGVVLSLRRRSLAIPTHH
ncbi:hypothetical protein Tco_0947611 [Tanacetum coccineum]